MIHVKIDGRKVTIPTSWVEVAYKDFIELGLLGNDLVAQVAYLCGMTKKELENGTFDEGLDVIFEATKFLAQRIFVHETPQRIGTYEPGTSIRTMAQLNAITAECQASAQTGDTRLSLESLATIAAIQCQGLAEPYDEEKVKYLSKQFMNMPALAVWEVGTYFHAKALSLVWRRDFASTLKNIRPGVRVKKQPFFKRLWHSLSSSVRSGRA